MAPSVRAGLEHVRLVRNEIGVALQKSPKEWQFDFLPVVFRGLRAEVDVAQLLPIASSPAAVRPGTHHQDVRDPRVLPLGPAVSFERTKQILSIVPATYRHHRATNVF